MFSVYTSFFNVQQAGFLWREALQNWLQFLDGRGEIVVAVNTSTDQTADLVRDYFRDYYAQNPLSSPQTKVVECAYSYDDPEFDGKIKAFALSHCSQPYCVLLDCDELVVPSQRELWRSLARELERDWSFDALLIPSVDLFHDENHYKSLSQKFYLHRNSPNITRGVVKWAYRPDGTIDIHKSDTTEAIYKDSGELVRAKSILALFPSFMQIGQMEGGGIPFVYHFGYLSKSQRLKQDSFWEPIWQLRDGSKIKTARDEKELDKIPYFPHHLPSWKSV